MLSLTEEGTEGGEPLSGDREALRALGEIGAGWEEGSGGSGGSGGTILCGEEDSGSMEDRRERKGGGRKKFSSTGVRPDDGVEKEQTLIALKGAPEREHQGHIRISNLWSGAY